MSVIQKLWQACLAGLLILVPTWATFLILAAMFSALDTVLIDLIGHQAESYIPGLGFVLLVLLVLGVGAIATHVLGQRLVRRTEAWLERIPLIRSVYLTLKSMTDLLNYRTRFGQSKVVAFPFPRDGLWALGFVMGTAPVPLQVVPAAELTMIFVPTAIHPFTGYLAFVPKDQLRPLNLAPEDALKLEFSAGLYRPGARWLSPFFNRTGDGR
ncbi:MAG TPA: DUF502 domain-containing protein [Nitrospiraceae bacterium]|nr:DUF502 domain-containing protein [Nitrospiraceae bacterium]